MATASLDNLIYNWVLSFMAVEDPFSYDILMLANRVEDVKIGTAAIGVKDHEIYLWYNPEWMRTLPRAEVVYLLRHEVMHMVLHHCTMRQPGDPDERQLANQAMDIAINDLIPEVSGCKMPTYPEDSYIDVVKAQATGGHATEVVALSKLPGKIISTKKVKGADGKPADMAMVKMPDGAEREFLKVGSKGDKMGEFSAKHSFPSRLSYEAYIDLLRKKKEEGEGKGKGKGKGKGGGNGQPGEGEGEGDGEAQPSGPSGFDEHGKFGESKIVDEIIRNQIEITQKSNRWGTIPAEVQEVIKKAQTTEIPWWTLLRHEFGRFISSKKVSTIKRPDKKHGYPWLGKKSDTQDAVLCGIDTSGSVDSKALAKFTAELERLNQYAPVMLMQFDCSLKQKTPMKLERRRLKELKILGRGGTDFQPIVDFAIEHRYKKLIIMSDGYAPLPDLHGKHIDLLWVITPDGSDEKFPGRTVKMKKLR